MHARNAHGSEDVFGGGVTHLVVSIIRKGGHGLLTQARHVIDTQRVCHLSKRLHNRQVSKACQEPYLDP